MAEANPNYFMLRQKSSKAYDLYRNIASGQALFDALEELIDDRFLTEEQAVKVILQFDYSVQKIMKKIQAEMKGHNCFSFEATMCKSRKMDKFQQYILKDVHIFQHFSVRKVQEGLYDIGKSKSNTMSKRLFDLKKNKNDVRLHVFKLPYVHLITQTCLEYSKITNTMIHGNEGRCKVDDEINSLNTNPRLAFYYLTPMEPKSVNENVQTELEEETIVLNRFKSSAMFAEKYQSSQESKDDSVSDIRPPADFKKDANSNQRKFKYTSFLKPNSSVPSIKASKPRKLAG